MFGWINQLWEDRRCEYAREGTAELREEGDGEESSGQSEAFCSLFGRERAGGHVHQRLSLHVTGALGGRLTAPTR